MAFTSPQVILICVALGLLFDRWLGEPRRWHPLVGFGHLATWVEQRFNRTHGKRWQGILAWACVVLPLCLVAVILQQLLADSWSGQILAGTMAVYLAVGWQSLMVHAQKIVTPLSLQDLDGARHAVAMIVSRDTAALDSQEVALAATESVLENGADAIFAALFWFAVAGLPGIVLYRLANTLDAMWGYKNERFLHFGWAAARLDDLLNYIPARLTALSYALAGNWSVAVRCWSEQGGQWKSPNAGPVMAAGAGAIGVKLGGAAPYHGADQLRPLLGPADGRSASASSIEAACQLINRTVWLWLLALAGMVVCL